MLTKSAPLVRDDVQLTSWLIAEDRVNGTVIATFRYQLLAAKREGALFLWETSVRNEGELTEFERSRRDSEPAALEVHRRLVWSASRRGRSRIQRLRSLLGL